MRADYGGNSEPLRRLFSCPNERRMIMLRLSWNWMNLTEDSRQPQCPVEKEKVIRDALEHLGMIQ